MINSKKIAGLVGPAMVAVGSSEAVNFNIWSSNIAPLIYLNGMILFVAGLAILRVHNSWRGWPLLITLVGWICMLGGLGRMFFPKVQQVGENSLTTIITATVFALIGIFITFKAYSKN